MKLLIAIFSLFLLCSCTDSSVDSFMSAGIGSLLRPAQNYPLNHEATLSYSYGGGGGGVSSHATLPTNLLSFWSCEDDAANTTVTDDTGNNDGTADVNTNTLADADGVVGNSFDLDGMVASRDYFNIGDIQASFGDHASLVMWIKLDDMPPNHSIRGGLAELDSSLGTYYPYMDSNMYCSIFRNDRFNFDISGGVDEATWHMLTITQTPGANGYKIYQNVTEIYSGAGEATVSVDAVSRIGYHTDGMGLDGRIDQIGLWSKSLSSDEVADLYNGGAGLSY